MTKRSPIERRALCSTRRCEIIVMKHRALAVLLRMYTRAYVPALLSWEAIAVGINWVAFRARCTSDRYAGERCASTRMGTVRYSCFIATGGRPATLRGARVKKCYPRPISRPLMDVFHTERSRTCLKQYSG